MTKHLSTQFDTELSELCSRVLEMGGLVESQVARAIEALATLGDDGAEAVLQTELRVNRMEVEIDRDLTAVIARRQPAASDLRLLLAVSRAIANLERIGDEAARIARIVRRLAAGAGALRPPSGDVTHAAQLATASLRKALDSFARLDVASALEVLKQDGQIDVEFEGLLRKLITYMMEDPRTISACIELVFVAKAIERVGDHAKNIAEAVIYIVKGTDVRHTSVESIEAVVR